MAKAEHRLSEMMEAGAEADTISCNTVIKARAEACHMARAEHWLAAMLKAGVEANTISYSTVNKSCAEAQLKEQEASLVALGSTASRIFAEDKAQSGVQANAASERGTIYFEYQ